MSDLEFEFLGQIQMFRLPPVQREYRFNPERRWRFDFAWPEKRVAVEIEGGVWSGGRHTRGSGFIADCEKYNAATFAGWRIFRFTAAQVHDLTGADMIKEVLNQELLASGTPAPTR